MFFLAARVSWGTCVRESATADEREPERESGFASLSDRWAYKEKRSHSGVFSGLATPVPIPNTAVKQSKADDSSHLTAKVGQRQSEAFFVPKFSN